MTHFHAQTIDVLLSDPLIQKVMRADRVEAGALKGMLTNVASQITERRRDRILALNGARVRFGTDAPFESAPARAPLVKYADCEGRCG